MRLVWTGVARLARAAQETQFKPGPRLTTNTTGSIRSECSRISVGWTDVVSIVVVAAIALAACPVLPAHALPVLGRAEIIARAKSALGSDYTWGRESWVPNQPGPGPDCSGYVLKCWGTPRTLLYQEEDGVNAQISPRYTTYHFYYNLGPWSSLPDRSYLREGDALVRYGGVRGTWC